MAETENPAKVARTGGGVTVCSAPGKVMVAGGYVVLERPNPALIAAVSARVYTCVSDISSSKKDGEKAQTLVEVDSPQLGETRRYKYSLSAEGVG
eukprot:CAMPEP_0172027206 /NCGR_PEP_ID=MMETSP1041-20130122/16873_1 /TAXON_ID=464988 /ORGANISM="Hemiselmis andersenii, Strain CCMP439" /LENGTH=94 /DNA_ID=CAMNT_0012683085 /DNA_START=37 /DNA_END=317 /DNA_ORIENTATION=-